ncbi:hypothetical protein [Natrarchaeobius oligotrophus]|uniref:Uncharacterized protein n=1 Tax=Natrarchaeobius chitinivorans TaxID=1679083 RepID=A0A3N6LU45_NATCH|nr:hypothetical protein [Natrarchaeobius chitinivorans]RQG93758.1 hypothetical protein EA472_22790 [Natrarchaeobius chitinivorans]
MSSLEPEELDALVRRTLAAQEQNSRYISSKKLRRLVQERATEDLSPQAISHSAKRVREDGYLRPWGGKIRSANTTYVITSAGCHRCGELHKSMAGAIYCCDETFDDIGPVAGTQSIRGPTPTIAEANGRGEPQ